MFDNLILMTSIFDDQTNWARNILNPLVETIGLDASYTLIFSLIAMIIFISCVKTGKEEVALNSLTAYFLIVAAMCGTVLGSIAYIIFGIGAGFGIAIIIYKNWIE